MRKILAVDFTSCIVKDFTGRRVLREAVMIRALGKVVECQLARHIKYDTSSLT